MVNSELKVCYKIMKLMERKLEDLMPEQEFWAFMNELAKAGFRVSVEELPDGDFKRFCQDQFEIITEEELE